MSDPQAALPRNHSAAAGDVEPHWFAVAVQHRHEKAIARHLGELGIESYLPLYRTRRTWSDRVKELNLPLFPQYVFGRFALCDRVAVLRIPGVRSLVGFGGGPTPIDESEIAALQKMTASGVPLQPWPYLKVGDSVQITRGPLQGIDGILVREKDIWRVVVSVHLLQRSVATEVERSDLALSKAVTTATS